MKKIQICSMKELRWLLRNKQIPQDDSYAIISSSYPLELPEISAMGYSYECYDDIDFACLGRCFTSEAAAGFARAIKENGSKQHWIFVCDGGCRRSSAVACAALRFWGREKEELEIWSDQRKEPNVWVYALMTQALGVPINDVDLDLRIHLNRTAIRGAFRKNATP